ncbi:cytochrome ubiquinol oxidase subunit I [Candidatus Lariskella endosymbiont of Hedychridium roseum]|uniref:cytochrome ubiquinol oxidase subunit I n=1 Tax=Candidatus Lariskella endosymbiont of Hedychridium roseum TaxID=3077949 RepID=UPI0030D40F86
MEFDPILLARIQFAFTISFHIIFPAISIGLASFLAVVEWRWLATKDQRFLDIYRLFVKIFAVTFGMGVVSGVVMSYEFGTNWSVFSDRVANVLGPLLSFEVLTAFFLEASFLGIMLFGWGRVSHRMHFFATCIVATGTLISAFWILSANSWMQTPQGFTITTDGRLIPTNWIEIIFNPSFPYRFIHMTIAAYLATSFFVGGVAAFYLLKKRDMPQARIMLAMAVIMVVIVSPIQLFVGHMHGENTMHYQPAKVAAMEGNWNHKKNAPLFLFGWPNQEKETTEYGITIPGGASWILTGDVNGKIPALKDIPKENRPPVVWVFWSFRVMVGIGMLMIGIGIVSTLQYFRGKLFQSKWLHIWWILMIPSGFIAILAGWFVTEIGRQPWTAYGIIRTAQSVSPAILGEQIAWSLAAFIVMYTLIFSAGIYYIVKLIRNGIPVTESGEQYYKHGIEASVIESIATKGGPHV